MEYRQLGTTGIDVSVIGFGASPLGGVFGSVSTTEAVEAVARAKDVGINTFDVSPYYGQTLAETRLGHALKGRRDGVVLATKCGRYGATNFDFSAQTVTRGFEESLRRLQTDYVDLLQVHDVEFGSLEQIAEETLPALGRLREQGKCRFIGITGFWPNLLARFASMVPVDAVLNYCHWNLLATDMDAALTPIAQREGIALLNASPLHMGLLGGEDPPRWHPAPEEVKAAAKRFAAYCRAHGQKPATFALAKCLSHPYVCSTFIGIRSQVEVDEAVAALTWEGDASFCQGAEQLLAAVQNTSWPSGKWGTDVPL